MSLTIPKATLPISEQTSLCRTQQISWKGKHPPVQLVHMCPEMITCRMHVSIRLVQTRIMSAATPTVTR